MEPTARVYAQRGYTDDKWIWWITSIGNNTTLARSARKYTTEKAAIKAAQAVAVLGVLEVDERNLS